MAGRTSMLHVRVDEELKARASQTLADVGLSVSDAMRILLARVAKEGGLPAGLTVDPETHDAWFRAKVREALEKAKIPLATAQITMVPQTTVELAGDDAEKMLKLMDALEEHDDVQELYTNVDIDDDMLEE